MIGSFAFAVVAGLLPEELLIGMAVVCLGVAGGRRNTRASLYRWMTCVALVAALLAELIDLYGLRVARAGVGLLAYGGTLIIDRFSALATVVIVILALANVAGSHQGGRVMRHRAGAHYALILVATAAASLLSAEREMIALFATFQVLLVSVSLLMALDKTSGRSSEAALKHLMLGGVGSGVLLYGMTILYGTTGSTDLASVPAGYAAAPALTITGLALTVIGLCVAIGAVPLHHRTPQVASGAPASVAAFALSVGVFAAMAAYLRVVVGGVGAGTHVALDLTAVIAALTMLYPAFMLMRPRSLRGASGYLILAQIGFMLVGVLSIAQGVDHRAGLVSLLVYAMGFGVTVVALFGAVSILEAAGLKDEVGALRGLGQRTGATALWLALALASLGGLPPLAIFVARLLVVESAVIAGYAWLAIVAALSSVMMGAACIRMIAWIYSDNTGAERLPDSTTPLGSRAVVGFCASAAILFTAVIQPLLAVSSGGAGTLPLR